MAGQWFHSLFRYTCSVLSEPYFFFLFFFFFMYLFLVFLLFFFHFCIVYYMRKKDFLSFFFLLNIISFLLVNTCLFFSFYLRPSSSQPSSQPSSSQPASQPGQLEWYRSVPRRGASPVSSATPSTELRVIYLTWMVTFPAFSTSHGFKAKHFSSISSFFLSPT